MMAFVMLAQPVSWPAMGLGLVLFVVAAIVVWRDGGVSRIVRGGMLALALAWIGVQATAIQVRDDFVINNYCAGLTTSDYMYWVYSCWALPDHPQKTPKGPVL